MPHAAELHGQADLECLLWCLVVQTAMRGDHVDPGDIRALQRRTDGVFHGAVVHQAAGNTSSASSAGLPRARSFAEPTLRLTAQRRPDLGHGARVRAGIPAAIRRACARLRANGHCTVAARRSQGGQDGCR